MLPRTGTNSIRGVSGGCGCKIGAASLLPALDACRRPSHERVLVDGTTADDAAVVQLSPELAIVQTIDFFPSPVDDPYDFGRIAAANALSDVYAMGGTPISALNVIAYPLQELGQDPLRQILLGGADVCAGDGVSVVGGHSILDTEAKFGLAVTGLVHPDEIVTNAGGQPGDILKLTKSLGVGSLIRAHTLGLAHDSLLRIVVETMATTNREASVQAVSCGVNAMTDVTGFGLLGHLHHVARESGLTAVVEWGSVPSLPLVDELLTSADVVSSGTRRNIEWSVEFTERSNAPEWAWRLCNEATTSGGLLLSLPPDRADDAPGVEIGYLEDGPRGKIRLV